MESIRQSFARAQSLGADTVLAPVAWEQFEPVEGSYDFRLLDEMLSTVDRLGLRLVPLWFGTWKNGMSSYCPSWVKQDSGRFPRARTAEGAVEHVSPFSIDARDADAKAFGALCAYVARADKRGAIPLIQVENEVGLLGDSRDRSVLAERAFAGAVPETVIAVVAANPMMPAAAKWVESGSRAEGTWPEVFGEGPATDELFMAHAYATYVDHVAGAGKANVDLPMFVNVWLDSEIVLPGMETHPDLELAGGQQPGVYPSGGPVIRVAPVWRACGPHIDFIAPDIYFGQFDDICADFLGLSGALFIPEMRRDAVGVGQMFRAVGHYGALGVSPFGIDSLTSENPDSKVVEDGYRLLGAARRLLADHPGAPVDGFYLTAEQPVQRLVFGDYTVVATARPAIGSAEINPGYGLVFQTSEGAFVAVGRGFALTFEHESGARVGLLEVDELDPRDEEWVRRLNGDETGSGSTVMHAPLDARQSTAIFPIPLNPSSSGISHSLVYLFEA